MCDGGIVERVTKGVLTGGLSEVSRATGLPVDPFTVAESVTKGSLGLPGSGPVASESAAPVAAAGTQAAPKPIDSNDPFRAGAAIGKRVKRGTGTKSTSLLTGGNIQDQNLNLSGKNFFN